MCYGTTHNVQTLYIQFCSRPELSWAQTLDTIALLGCVSIPEPYEGSMPTAREEGLMCPAVIEIVCEALQSSGRVPERLMASWTPSAVGVVQPVHAGA